MAKSTKAAKQKAGGPFLAAAVFCDSVLRGEDGVLTVVRIIDRITITIPADAPPEVPSDKHRLLTQIEGLVGFKSGYAGGKHELKLVIQSPSGKRQVMVNQTADFKAEVHGGYHLRLKTGIAVGESGLYLVDVFLDGKRMTRMPLLIVVQRLDAADAPVASVARGKKRKTKAIPGR